MKDENLTGWKRFVPRLSGRRWTLLLGASLMANLLIGGAILGYRFKGDERLMGASAIQLVPRSFIAQLPRERRRELMGVVRQEMKNLRELRDGSSDSILKFAAALEQTPENSTAIREALANHITGPESLAAKSEALIISVIEKMTPEEKKALAAAIRERAERVKGKRK